MSSEKAGLTFAYRKIGLWTVPTLEFPDSEFPSLHLPVPGYIANSIPTSSPGRDKLEIWKALVASQVKASRGGMAWNPQVDYAIAVSFSFNPRNHGNRRRSDGQCHLDVENFVKPVIDALAAGLFCDERTDVRSIPRWDYDDSNFNTLLIHRLEDTHKPEEEGIAICVSALSLGG